MPIINYNSMASNALRQLNVNQSAQAKSMAKLSSGLRINTAADDAAGLAISEKMKGQIRGLDQASRNAQDGQSLVNTAEGALSQTTDILQRMRELAVQSSSDTATDSDRQQIQKEVQQLKSETDRIANTTQFNTKNLLDGSLTSGQVAQGTKLQSVSLNMKAAVTGSTLTPSSYQIDSTNNKLIVNDGSQDYTVTIASGSYAAGTGNGTLAKAVQDAIRAASTNFGDVTIGATGSPATQLTVVDDGSTSGATGITIKAGGSANALLGITSPITQAHGTSGSTATSFQNTANYNAVTIDGTHNTLNFNLDGGNAQSITLTNGNYTGSNLATQINQQIALNSSLVGKVSASYDATANKITFSDLTNNNGSSSILTVGGNASAIAGVTSGTTVDGSTTTLVSLNDGNGNSLGVQSGDVLNISANVGKQAISSTLNITGATTVTDLKNSISSALGINSSNVALGSDGSIQITGNNGLSNEISGLKLSINNRNLFNNELSSFTETQSAQDAKQSGALTLQIGANQSQTMSVNIEKMDTESLGLSSVDLTTSQGAQNAITMIDNATQKVSSQRAALGAFSNRLDYTVNNLNTASQNTSDAQSRIANVDMAKEMMNQSKSSVLAQAAQAMLAQANQQPQQVLQLLR